MNRRRIFSGFTKILPKDVVIFCIGKELISEAKFETFGGVCYFDDLSVDYLAIALGIAMASKKRIFLFCEDSYLMRYINTVAQISVSGCTNMYVMVFRTSVYSNNLYIPSLAKTIRSLKATLFNLGVLVHDYTIYFESANSVTKLKGILIKSLGPLVALIDVDNKRLYGDGGSVSDNISKLCDFVLEDHSKEAN